MEIQNFVVGIDLGTTYSCCHIFNIATQQYECLKFLNNNKTIPSIVNFNSAPVVVGVPYENAVCEMKRLIGMKYTDEKVQEMLSKKAFPFDVIEGEDGYAAIKVFTEKTGKEEILTPEMVSGMVLREIDIELKRKFNLKKEDVIKAVISVPAYFTEQQKDATKMAAQMSGFELLEMIYEPTCALKAYNLENKRPGYYLAFDLGGGTFDLTIMNKDAQGNNIIPIFTGGHTHLGGVDFDLNFLNFIVDEINKDDPDLGKKFILNNKDLPRIKNQKKKRLYNLRKMVEKAKIELSSCMKTTLDISTLVGEEDGSIEYEFYREDFEKCNMELFKKAIQITVDGVASKNINRSSIREIILVGGSSRIPIITELLRAEFPGIKINNEIDGDLIVSLGACQYARQKMLEGFIDVKEVVVYPIMIKNYNQDNRTFTLTEVVKPGTLIPNPGQETAFWADQVEAYIELVEEGRDLGVFTIKGIPARARNTIQHFVISVELDGMIHVKGDIEGKPFECSKTIQKKSENEAVINRNKEYIEIFF